MTTKKPIQDTDKEGTTYNMTKRIQLAIFDLDGTIADTLEAIREAVNLTMTEYHWPTRSYEQVRFAVGNGARKIVERSMPKELSTDEALVTEALAKYDHHYGNTFLHTDTCYPKIPEVLAELKKRGIKLAMLSNKQDPYTKALAAQLVPTDTFLFVAGQTDLPKKPDPTVPLSFADNLHVDPADCVMIGDSSVDVQTGKNAGMHTIGCSWGFRPRSTLIEAGAEYIADHPIDLLKIDLLGGFL